MDTVKKSGYATDDDKEWGTGNYQHISENFRLRRQRFVFIGVKGITQFWIT